MTSYSEATLEAYRSLATASVADAVEQHGAATEVVRTRPSPTGVRCL
ncbi:hypothetical protein [Streptomyces niveus]